LNNGIALSNITLEAGVDYHLDEEASSATEKILCGTLLEVNDQQTGISHKNFFVSGPVDFEAADAIIPSDRIVQQNVAVYEKPLLSSKVCGSVAMGGPRMTREGLSLQFSFRHDDCRMRVMVAYEPFDFVAVPSTSIQIPSSLAISDITIAREKLLTSSLTPTMTCTDLNPPLLWRATSIDKDFGGLFSGVKDIYIGPEINTGGLEKNEEITLGVLPFYEDYEESLRAALASEDALKTDDDDDDDDDDEDEMEFVKFYNGGLLINAPLVILAGEESDIKVAWSVPLDTETNSPSRTVYIADASFSAMNDVVNKTRRKRRGDTFVEQPIITSFSTQTLHKK
jgi:hypothetical protein